MPGAVVVAFWALETDFGANNGNLPVLRSVLTLAYDCRRPDMFREELIYALKVVQRGDLTPSQMVAPGRARSADPVLAVGLFQIRGRLRRRRPRRLHPQRARRDCVVANLLARKANGSAASPGCRRCASRKTAMEEADLKIKHPRSQWAKWGVTQANGAALQNDDLPASLVLPMGRLGPAFLAYENFNAFLEWNQSLVYATTAAYLATRLSGAPRVHPGNGTPQTLTASQVLQLQTLLARQGYDAGKQDGKLGLTTRAAVKQAQLKLGLPADSYPTGELITRLGGSFVSVPEDAPRPVAGPTARAPKQGQAPKRAKAPNP